MKTVSLLIILILLAFPGSVLAQCGGTVQYLTYDTTVTGNGEAIHLFTFPKFNVPTGTLMQVRLQSQATVGFGFKAENTSATQAYPVYRVRVSRNDDIYSSVLPGPTNAISLTFPTANYPNPLTVSDGVPGSGPDFHEEPYGYALNHVMRQEAITNTAGYLGTGNVEFEYTINSSTIVPFGTNLTVPLDASSADTLTYSITYVYCQAGTLSTKLLDFFAKKRNESVIDITWFNPDGTETKEYILEKSTDGINFTTVTEFAAKSETDHTGKYFFQYNCPAGEYGKIAFRLKEIDKNNMATYSRLRVIDISDRSSSFQVYPNPGGGNFTIVFGAQRRGDWLVDVLSVNGQLLDRFNFKNSYIANIDVRKKLPKGTYLVRSVDQRSMDTHLQKVIIR